MLAFIACNGQVDNRIHTRPGGQNGDQGAGGYVDAHRLQALAVHRPGDQTHFHAFLALALALRAALRDCNVHKLTPRKSALDVTRFSRLL